MKLEALVRNSSDNNYWVATIVMASGPLLLLRFDGSEEDRSGDFWCDAASADLQPIGFCTRTNNILLPPAGAVIWHCCINSHRVSVTCQPFLFTNYAYYSYIGDFWVAFHFCFKASPSAKPKKIWRLVVVKCKWTELHMWIKPIFMSKALPWTCFETEAKGNSEIAY